MLYATGTGVDTGIDIITDFDSAGGDRLELKDVLVGFNPATSALSNFLSSIEISGNTSIAVSPTGSGSNFVPLVVLTGVIGFDLHNTLLYDGQPIV